MAFAGGFGARIFLEQVPHKLDAAPMAAEAERLNSILLFAESNTRFLCEVPQDAVGHFESILGDVPHAAIGEVIADAKLQIVNYDPGNPFHVIDADLIDLKQSWQKTLNW
jgi:phosphoribosylformylglycinamidine (FGAM) synthase-like enzyme